MKSNFDEPGAGYVQGITTGGLKELKMRSLRKGIFIGLLAGVVLTYIAMKKVN